MIYSYQDRFILIVRYILFFFIQIQSSYSDQLKLKTFFSPKLNSQFKIEKWTFSKPKKSYQIGILIPHLEDRIWTSAIYGFKKENEKLGLKLKFLQAGSYDQLGNQIRQIKHITNELNFDAVIISPVNEERIESTLKELKSKNIPIIDYNSSSKGPINARISPDFFKIGEKIAKYILKVSNEKDIKITIFPGPKNINSSTMTYKGIIDYFDKNKKDQKIKIDGPYYGDTRPLVQASRIKLYLKNDKNFYDTDYIIGCSTAAIEAVRYLTVRSSQKKRTKIISTYLSDIGYDFIENNLIMAGILINPLIQSKLALDMAIKILNKEGSTRSLPYQLSEVDYPLITVQNIKEYSKKKYFAPQNYNYLHSKD